MPLRLNKLILIFPLLLASCSAEKETVETRLMLDTSVEMKAFGQGPVDTAPVWSEIKVLEGIFSPYSPDSGISKVNSYAGVEPVRVSTHLIAAMTAALDAAKATGGAYDPTVLPLVRLWGISSGNTSIPSEQDIRNALEKVDFESVSVSGGSIFLKRKGMAADLSNLSKGYIADFAAEQLRKAGASSALVNAGGDVRVSGKRAWKIGIKHPRAEGEMLAVISLREGAVSTSGDYERYFMKDGRRYHHIFDTKTGYPSRASISATVVAPNCVLSNALALSAFLLGPEKGMALVKKYPGTEAVIVDMEGRVFVSGGLKQYVKLRQIELR